MLKRIIRLKYKISNMFLKHKMKHCGDNTRVSKPMHIANFDRMSFGNNVLVLNGAVIDCKYKQNERAPELIVGDNVFINYRCIIICSSKIYIGSDVIIGPEVMIIDDNHNIEHIEQYHSYGQSGYTLKNISIGNGSWIGGRVTILPGVNIGKRCIIGAGAVVNTDIPDYCMAVGCPAKIIKKYNFKIQRWERV